MENVKKLDPTLLLLLTKALALKTNLYNDIDNIYSAHKNLFYEAANKTNFYNHYFFKQNSIETEIYCKKTLGIVAISQIHLAGDTSNELANETYQQFLSLLRKGYNRTYKVLERNHIINEQLWNMIFTYNNDSTDSLLCSSAVVLILSVKLKNQAPDGSAMIPGLKNVLGQAYKYIAACNSMLSDTNPFDGQFKDIFTICKSYLRKAYGGNIPESLSDIILHDFGKSPNTNDTITQNYFYAMSPLLVKEQVPLSCVEATTFGNKDLKEIILSYIEHVLKPKSVDYKPTPEDLARCLEFFNLAFILKAYGRNYVQAKNYFFNNTDLLKDTDELKSVKREITSANQKISDQIKLLEEKQRLLNELQEKYDKLYKNNDALKDELQNITTSYTEQIDSLLDTMQASYVADADNKINPKEVENLNVLIFGGTDNWQQKMHNLFPKFKFVSAVNPNFDITLIDNSDYIIFNCLYASHGSFYKLSNYMRSKGKNLIYLNNSNEQYLIEAIHKATLTKK